MERPSAADEPVGASSPVLPGNGHGLATRDGVKINFVIGTDASDKVSFGGDVKKRDQSFPGDRARLSLLGIFHVKTNPVAGLVAGKQYLLSVG